MGYQEIREKVVKPRKHHTCEWCATPCIAGEPCVYRAYIFEGDFNSGYMHMECFDAMGKSDHELVSEGWIPGEPTRGVPLK